MSLKKLFVLCVLVFTFLFVMAADAQACHRYIVGHYVTTSNVTHAFRAIQYYNNNNPYFGTSVQLDYPDAVLTVAYGVNDAGIVVGYYEDSSGYNHGFKWTGGSNYSTIDYPYDAVHTVIGDITNDGFIVGYYEDTYGVTHGFVYDPSLSQYVSIDYDANSDYNTLWGLNDAEMLVGNYIDANGDLTAFYYDYHTPSNKGVLPDCYLDETGSRGINEAEIIVGSCGDFSSGVNDLKGYIVEDFDTCSAEEYPDASNTNFRGIDDDSKGTGHYTIVGFYKDTSSYTHGLFYYNESYTSWDYDTGLKATRFGGISNWVD